MPLLACVYMNLCRNCPRKLRVHIEIIKQIEYGFHWILLYTHKTHTNLVPLKCTSESLYQNSFTLHVLNIWSYAKTDLFNFLGPNYICPFPRFSFRFPHIFPQLCMDFYFAFTYCESIAAKSDMPPGREYRQWIDLYMSMMSHGGSPAIIALEHFARIVSTSMHHWLLLYKVPCIVMILSHVHDIVRRPTNAPHTAPFLS